ncbi:hypothetical protein KAFR_0K00350 [Kazachstania africana CBS 2517]|uniref:Uncharacterized protein n=1 Tax=Kazachstania africana (strain ATCC 22294 / BCRC 22015 / CBS 2517 / CECT 1963 / NBRC 1671 / NRRL Y-8276) TaxID=1071382 RepID=H2B190_KAZAF|nr:hypothetical protein KAFR_0K00350 [Kazachstania africana CBS 2517]CCF60390.1 hypothetical protein KAFR_0K00350 [Kazachstania africana CBS 2517]
MGLPIETFEFSNHILENRIHSYNNHHPPHIFKSLLSSNNDLVSSHYPILNNQIKQELIHVSTSRLATTTTLSRSRNVNANNWKLNLKDSGTLSNEGNMIKNTISNDGRILYNKETLQVSLTCDRSIDSIFEFTLPHGFHSIECQFNKDFNFNEIEGTCFQIILINPSQISILNYDFHCEIINQHTLKFNSDLIDTWFDLFPHFIISTDSKDNILFTKISNSITFKLHADLNFKNSPLRDFIFPHIFCSTEENEIIALNLIDQTKFNYNISSILNSNEKLTKIYSNDIFETNQKIFQMNLINGAISSYSILFNKTSKTSLVNIIPNDRMIIVEKHLYSIVCSIYKFNNMTWYFNGFYELSNTLHRSFILSNLYYTDNTITISNNNQFYTFELSNR